MRYDLLHPKALRKAVIEYLGTDENVPQERQFRRWVSGDTPVPAWVRRAVDELMATPDTAKAPPGEPDGAWVARMLEAIAAAVGVDTDEVERLARAAGLEQSRLQADATRQTEDQTVRDG